MWLVASLGCFALSLLGHRGTRRLRRNAVTRFLACGSLIGLALAVCLVRGGSLAVESLAALVVYAFLCELYLFLFTLAGNSVSATLLLLLGSGSMAPGAIGNRLGGKSMVALRIEGLLATGLLHRTGAAYVVTERGRALISFFDGLRRFFGQER